MQNKSSNTIVVVDDNEVITRMLEGLLTSVGYQVVVYNDSITALEHIESVNADLILLDIEMPELSGIELCRRLKENPNTLEMPILFVTSRAAREDIIGAFEAGGQDYIVKPFIRAELLARVRTHITLRQMQEDLRASVIRYRHLAIIDDLTGFYNTRYLYQHLQSQIEEHPETCVTTIFIDVDSFKEVVDTYGHLNGSSVLAELAEAIMPLLPENCYGVSYGGDEFVIVLKDFDRLAGREMAERIRSIIAETCFLQFCDLQINITISSGVATYPHDAGNFEELLANADHALFAAKRLGKNRVVSFHEVHFS